MIGCVPAARRARRRWVAIFMISAVLTAAGAAPADAYVRYLTDTGQPFHWAQSCVPMGGFPNDLTDMTPAEIGYAAEQAASVWSSEALACTYMQINIEMSSKPTRPAKNDSFNSLLFRRDWCGTSATGSCSHDPSALAITSVFVRTRDGLIVDGDIEVNAQYFVWANLDSSAQRGGELQDLQNALTHEMGHLIGLDHTCFSNGSTRARPVDNLGELIPDCDKASAAVRETTMFASADMGDITKRTLAADDQLAACEIYPVAQDPQICPTLNLTATTGSGGLGCAAAGSGEGGAAGWASLVLILTVALARTRRRKHPV